MSFFELWLLFTLLPNLSDLCMTFIIIALISGGMAALCFCLSSSVYDEPVMPVIWGHSKKLLWLLIPSIIVVAIPARKEMAFLLSAKYVTNNEQLAELPPKLLNAFNKYLDDILQHEEEAK